MKEEMMKEEMKEMKVELDGICDEDYIDAEAVRFELRREIRKLEARLAGRKIALPTDEQVAAMERTLASEYDDD